MDWQWLNRFGLTASVGAPFGFPVGWMVCNISHGEYGLALSNLVVTAIIGTYLVWSRYRQDHSTRR